MAIWKKSWTKQHDGVIFFGGDGYDEYRFDVPTGYEFVSCTASVTAGRANPGVRIHSRPSAGDRRSGRKIKIRWWFDGHARPFIKYKVTAKCRTARTTVGETQRALLMVCDLAALGNRNLRWLYEGIDSNGPSIINAMLSKDYRTVKLLKNSRATKNNFIRKLKQLAVDRNHKVVDTVLMLHGSDQLLYFRGGSVDVNDLTNDLQQVPANRLRACFSTACYGASHAEAIVRGGFRVACGAIGVFANGAYAIPVAMSKWSEGASFSECVRAANNSNIVAASDAVARLMGFDRANSHWNIKGKGATRITTVAT